MVLDIANIPLWVLAYLSIGNTMWAVVYVFCLMRGSRDKTYCIPPTAMAANWMWEVTFAFIYPPPAPISYSIIPWVFFTSVLVYQYFKHAKSDVAVPNMDPKWIVPVFAASCAVGLAFTITITQRLGDGGWHSSVVVNMLDSVLWIHMLLRRNSLRGQNIYIGIFKMLGTFGAYSGCFLVFGINYPILMVGAVTCFLLDAWYIGMVVVKAREHGFSPWAVHPWNPPEEAPAKAPSLAVA